jgi:hypothetical protein
MVVHNFNLRYLGGSRFEACPGKSRQPYLKNYKSKKKKEKKKQKQLGV